MKKEEWLYLYTYIPGLGSYRLDAGSVTSSYKEKNKCFPVFLKADEWIWEGKLIQQQTEKLMGNKDVMDLLNL